MAHIFPSKMSTSQANTQILSVWSDSAKCSLCRLAPCEYKTGKTLGQGSYGVVKEGVKISTGERFAVKMISKKLMRGKEALILNEINILKKVSKGNKNIVKIHNLECFVIARHILG